MSISHTLTRPFYVLLTTLILPASIFAAEMEFPLDLLLFEKKHEVTAYLDDEDENYWALSGNELLSLLEGQLDSERLDTLRQQIQGQKVSQTHFEQFGWTSHYSLDELLITLSLPVTERKVIDLAMTRSLSRTPSNDYQHIQPDFVSGIINTSWYHNQNLKNTEYSSSSATIEAAIAIGDVTFEDRHTYSYAHHAGEGQWQRNIMRMMYDLPNDWGYLQLGDYYTETDINTLSGGDLFGLSYSFQPDYLSWGVRPNSVPLRLENAALVTININGEQYRVLRLAAGQYNLRDLPLEQGINEVEVVYRDRSGNEQRRFFNLIDSPQLLLNGDIETQWVVGVEQDYDEDGIKTLEEDKVGAHAVISYGLTDWWTLSPLVEWQEEEQKYQLRNNFAIGDNFLSLSGYHQTSDSSKVNQGTLQFYAPTFFYDRFNNFSLFYTLTDSTSYQGLNHTVSLSSGINTPLDNGYFSYTLSNTFNAGERVSQSASINSSYRWFNRYTTSLNLRWQEYYNQSETSVYFSFSLPLNWNNISIYARSSYNSQDEEYNNEISASQYKTDYYWRTSAAFVDSDYEGFDGYAKLYGDRVDWSASLYSSNEHTDYSSRSMTLGAQTGLVWAGSDFQWTSPVNNSFTIVSLPEKLEDKYALEKDVYGRMKIIPKEQGGQSSQILDIADRSYRNIRVDGSELDFNEELVSGQLAALSKRRTGSSYEIDITKGYFVTGNFHNQNNQPVEDLVGEFQRANSSQTYPFFTGADGGFELDVLPPGDYRIYFYDGKAEEMYVSIKEAHVIEDTFIELGQLNIRTY
ncbi:MULTISPECIES: hypothetical protein [unclassified Vibrio]|uniref:Pilus assembly protein PapC n=1 Tax=Vibrio sp. HB236076 TaxID=3232307 RepID=A0AB39HHE8_9VIBR|nr:hypothetical protein [Vibrio sp. HB161653]MDP5253141.1 hypothetical protein [Vibrio sp. HB161653]